MTLASPTAAVGGGLPVRVNSRAVVRAHAVTREVVGGARGARCVCNTGHARVQRALRSANARGGGAGATFIRTGAAASRGSAATT